MSSHLLWNGDVEEERLGVHFAYEFPLSRFLLLRANFYYICTDWQHPAPLVEALCVVRNGVRAIEIASQGHLPRIPSILPTHSTTRRPLPSVPPSRNQTYHRAPCLRQVASPHPEPRKPTDAQINYRNAITDVETIYAMTARLLRKGGTHIVSILYFLELHLAMVPLAYIRVKLQYKKTRTPSSGDTVWKSTSLGGVHIDRTICK